MLHKTTKRILYLTFGFMLAFGLAISAHAQFRAAVQGSVTDPNGAVVSGANVTLTSNETGRSQQTTTSGNGFYRFSGLAPGLYTLTVEQQNFQQQKLENINVAAENTQGLDVVLTAGGINETVTVSSDATPALETENPNVQKSITTE